MKKSSNALEKELIRKIDRRDFLKLTGVSVSGIILGIQAGCTPAEKASAALFAPNVYLTLHGDGSVEIIAHRSEMGTGIRTGLPLIIADEMEADWQRVKVVQAPGDEAKYGNQNTDGSFSVRMFFEPMRKAGATARTLLQQAAAQRWGVAPETCKVQNHEVVHEASGKKLGFGELAEDAARLPLPAQETLTLKPKSAWRYIGRSTSIVDVHDISSGKAVFGLDVVRPGMKYATVLRCPVAGGKVKSFDATEALKVAGVEQVFELAGGGFPAPFQSPLGGVVVVANSTWAAMQGRKQVQVEWDLGANADYDTRTYVKELVQKVQTKGNTRRQQGDAYAAISTAAFKIEATYTIPHLSHAPMEPPNAVAHFKDGSCEVWAPTQHPQWARDSVAQALEVDVKNVTVNIMLLGGGFGRKSKPDYVVEAALISKKINAPVKVTWTREDDIRHDFFHACSAQHIRVGLDKSRKVVAWNHRSAFPPIDGTTTADANEPSFGELQLGMVDLPFDIPHISCESHEAKAKTRIGWLRSVSNIQHAFAIGSMLDEIATLRKVDPVKNLLELLGPDRNIPFDQMMEGFGNYGEPLAQFPWSTKRLRGVIELVAEKSGWGTALPKGQGMGICAHRSFLTYVACVVKVAVENGRLTIPELHYAVDCGVVVNRNSVVNQFEGGAVFALGAALKSGISFAGGQAEQSNFDGYQVARLADAPARIFVHLVESDEKPTGVGEPPVPPVAPALANAIFAATGKRYRDLPIVLS